MKKNRLKIAIDVVITVALVLLYNVHAQLGLAFHEWAGILILIGFALHIAISWDWVVAVTRRFFGRTTARTRFLYVLDVLVLVTMTWTILSGVFISRIAVPQLASGAAGFWRTTHVPISYLTLIVIGVHLGVHWEWVQSVVRRILGRPRATPAIAWVLRGVAALVLVGGVVSVVNTNAIAQAASLSGATGGAGGRAEGGRGMPGGDPGHLPGQGRGQGGPGQAGLPGGGHGEGGRGGASGSDLAAALLHAGVIGAFAVPTYYADRLVAARRRRLPGASAA